MRRRLTPEQTPFRLLHPETLADALKLGVEVRFDASDFFGPLFGGVANRRCLGSSGRSFRVGLFGDSASVNTGFVTDPLGLDLCFASQRFYLRPRGLAKVV